jgi:signal transduction histidine kinase
MRLTAKIVTVFVLMSVIVTGVNGFLRIRREANLFESDMIQDVERFALLMEQWVTTELNKNGWESVQRLIRELDSQDQYSQIRWVWLDVTPPNTYAPQISTSQLRKLGVNVKKVVSIKKRKTSGDEVLCAYRRIPLKIRIGDQVVRHREGAVELIYDLTPLNFLVRKTIVNTCVTMGTLLLLSIVMMGFMGVNVVAQPLQKLIQKTRRAGEGDLTGDVDLGGNDELTELGQSLNNMCRQLSESQEAVQAETLARIAALEQLRHVDRLQTVGRLASGIAHELGTPLNVVSGRAGLIASGKLCESDVAESARSIKSETDRMATIIQQLLDFARRRTPQRVSIDLHQIAIQTAQLLDSLAQKRNVQIEVIDNNNPVTAFVDVGQLQQVLTNLIVNAIQSINDGGRVQIRMGYRFARPPEGHAGEADQYDFIDIEDDGEGIADEHLDHIFEPFFTTKEVGEGTGLGLSLSYGIIDEHGGWIAASSQVNKGTCFTVYLPREERKECSEKS